MTLRNKLTIVLVVLSVAPLLLVGWLGYREAVQGLRTVAESRLGDTATGIARDVARARIDLNRAVAAAAASPEVVRALEDPVGAGRPGEENAVPAISLLDEDSTIRAAVASGGRIELHDSNGGLVYRSPTSVRPEHRRACAQGDRHGSVRITAAVTAADGTPLGHLGYRGTVASVVPASLSCRHVGLVDRSIVVLNRDAGSVLLAPGDGDVRVASAELLDRDPLLPRSAVTSGTARTVRDGDTGRMIAYADVSETPWTVVAMAELDDLEGPLRGSLAPFGLFLLLVAAAIAIAGKLVVGRLLAPLDDVASAADRIGKDELVPWLPLPADDEIGRLALSVNRMADRIERQMRHLEHSSRVTVVQDLAAYLSTKMRGPLSSIRLSLQALQREQAEREFDGPTHEALRTSLEEVSRLDRLVSSVDKLGSSRPAVVRPCSIRRAIHEAAALLEPKLVREQIRFRAYLHDGADTVPADPGQLKNVFLQLFLNSINAVEVGGMIEIRTGVAEVDSGEVVVVRVRDDGGGVDPGQRDRIFDPFFTTGTDSAGLGLAIARRSIRSFGGDLELVRAVSARGGAEFSIILPLIESPGNGKFFRRPPDPAGGILATDAWRATN